MIIICTMSYPLPRIRFLLSARVLLSQERFRRSRLHCCTQELYSGHGGLVVTGG